MTTISELVRGVCGKSLCEEIGIGYLCGLIPFGLIAMYFFHRYKYRHYYQKRHVPLVLIQLVSSLAIALFLGILLIVENDVRLDNLRMSLMWTFGTFSVLSVAVNLSAQFTRIHVLSFDCRVANEYDNKKWKRSLNPEHFQNWFQEHRNTWGNWFNMFRWVLGFAFGFSILFLTLLAVLPSDTLLQLVWMYVSVVFIVSGLIGYMWYYTPYVKDTTRIRRELKYSSWLLVVTLLSTAFLLSGARENFGLIVYAGVPIFIVAWCLQFIIVVYWVIYVNEKDVGVTQSLPKELQWYHITYFVDGYEAFAQFLTREFALESLLFLTEYMKLKLERISTDVRHPTMTGVISPTHSVKSSWSPMHRQTPSFRMTDLEENFAIDFPEGIINLSALSLQGSNTMRMYFQLFKKYVEPGKAPLEINLRSITRECVCKLFESANVEESEVPNSTQILKFIRRFTSPALVDTMSSLLDSLDRLEEIDLKEVEEQFDKAAQEISVLLRDSYSRFLLAPEFQTFWETHGEKVCSVFEIENSTTEPAIVRVRSVSGTHAVEIEFGPTGKWRATIEKEPEQFKSPTKKPEYTTSLETWEEDPILASLQRMT